MKNLKKDRIEEDIRDCGYNDEEIVNKDSKKYKKVLVESSMLQKKLLKLNEHVLCTVKEMFNNTVKTIIKRNKSRILRKEKNEIFTNILH